LRSGRGSRVGSGPGPTRSRARRYTRTITEEELLDPRRANHLVAVRPEGELVGLAWADLSPVPSTLPTFPGSRLTDELDRLAPEKCRMPRTARRSCTICLRRSPWRDDDRRTGWTFDRDTTRARSLPFLSGDDGCGAGLLRFSTLLERLRWLAVYLKETCKAQLAHLRRPRPYRAENHLLLDEATRRSLELTRTLREGKREGIVAVFP